MVREKISQIIRAERGALSYIPILTAVLCWMAAVLFVEFFTSSMDVHTMNFFRYFGGSLLLTSIVLIAYPGCFRKYIRRLPVFLTLGAMVVTFQVCWVSAFYYAGPAFISILGKFSTPLITLLAFVIFREERRVIKSPRFIAGFLLGFFGVTGVIAGIGNPAEILASGQAKGIILVLCSSVVWAAYSNLVKHVLKSENSLQAFTFTCISATVFFLPLMIFYGEPGRLVDFSPAMIALVLFSGMVGIAGANTNYYLSIKKIGLATTSNLALITPLLTVVASYFIFSEKLSFVQILFAIILIFGCILVVSAREKVKRNVS